LDPQILPRTITGVLGSLKRRVDIFNEESCNLRHPLFATRPQKRALLVARPQAGTGGLLSKTAY
jgi:hypothetical protein